MKQLIIIHYFILSYTNTESNVRGKNKTGNRKKIDTGPVNRMRPFRRKFLTNKVLIIFNADIEFFVVPNIMGI
jgi:hypothetical protein